MKDPTRTDILLAIWSTLALSDEFDEFLGSDLGEEALAELFADLQADLMAADVLMAEDFDDWAIAAG